MANFNFVDAAGRGYKFVWDERRMLIHYGFWPVMLKIASFVLITAFELDKNMLRQGLILLPAYFLEGWLVVIAIRFAIFGEATPEPLNAAANYSPQSQHRRRTILAGMLIYLLIRLASSFLSGVAIGLGENQYNGPQPEPTAGAYFTVLVVMMGMLWAFRFFWLYVPVIMDYPIKPFLKKIAGFGTSVYMLALWMLCMVPVVVFMVAIAKILLFLLPGRTPDVPSLEYVYVLSALQAVMETLVAVVASVAMAYGVREILSGPKR